MSIVAMLCGASVIALLASCGVDVRIFAITLPVAGAIDSTTFRRNGFNEINPSAIYYSNLEEGVCKIPCQTLPTVHRKDPDSL